MAHTVQERINQYLEDTIGAERNFEKALSTFGEAGEQTSVQQLLSSASAKAKTQHERLEALLEEPRRNSIRRKNASCRDASVYAAFRADRPRGGGEKYAASHGDLRCSGGGDGYVRVPGHGWRRRRGPGRCVPCPNPTGRRA